MISNQKKEKIEFGDFQTPAWFCEHVCDTLVEKGINPFTVLEPTCGQGNFLLAALDRFSSVKTAVGVDINAEYTIPLQQKIASRTDQNKISILHSDFFHMDWQQIITPFPTPLLILGNPPWVTNSQLSILESNNLPKKSNFYNHTGIEAITGGGNFDVSEWMLIKMLEWAGEKRGIVAMLCKTAVARKVLLHNWRTSDQPGIAQIHLIDAKKIFDVSVDACLFIYNTTRKATKSCDVFSNLSEDSFLHKIGCRDGQMIADLEQFERWKHLQNSEKVNTYRWRSGIKHDCVEVMELEKTGGRFRNKLGETYELESTYLYPMLKSSDVANGKTRTRSRWMLVTQQSVGGKTARIKTDAPKTWAYLTEHHDYFVQRKSSIYKNRPSYSIFGVGSYSFAPWKVAISGLYKTLNFTVVEPTEDKPTVLDDTCYFLPCDNKDEAEFIAWLLNLTIARQFFESFIFWDKKRPITAKILGKLNIYRLAEELGYREKLENFRTCTLNKNMVEQLRLFEELPEYMAD